MHLVWHSSEISCPASEAPLGTEEEPTMANLAPDKRPM